MPVDIKPASQIIARLGLEPNGRVQKLFTETCYKAMDKFVPKDRGLLRTIVDLESDSITYEMPYARYQFYGQREDGSHKVRRYTTPGTGSRWDKRMWAVKKDEIINAMQKELGR